MYLFFDTETTGLPRSWNAPISELDNWPRMVQIAWLVYGLHGITTDMALERGVPLRAVLQEFSRVVDESTMVIAHNMDFDEKIVGAELLRKNVPCALFERPRFCTMKSTTDFCRIPRKHGYKRPKLSELHLSLFGENFAHAHNAIADVAVCAKCFFELRRIGFIKIGNNAIVGCS